MAYWTVRPIRASKEDNLLIIRADSKKGDVFSGQAMFDNRTGGVQFLTKGAVAIYNNELAYGETYSADSRFMKPVSIPLINKEIILSTKEDARFYCIMSQDQLQEYDGEVIVINAGDSLVLNDIKTKRIFIASDNVSVDGVGYTQNRVLKVESKDSVTVTAGDTPATIAVFYKV